MRTHGGLDLAEAAALRIDPAGVIDFSVNVNPYGPHPAMLEAVRGACHDRYPDPTALRAREALADAAGVHADRVVLGNGAADLLWTLARALVRPGDTALVVEPTFSELSAAVEASGGRAEAWRSSPEAGFVVDVDAAAEAARKPRASLVYLGTPNNPTGSAVDPAAVVAFALRVAPAVVVLDEAFLSLSEGHDNANIALPENVVRVRSLTKDHAIPGVRVGYLLAPAPLAAALEARRPPWSTSAAAQAAAEASVALASFVAQSRERLLADRRALQDDLRRLGLRPHPSVATFFLVPVPDAAALRRGLLARHGVLVRDCTSFGLPRHVRLGARPASDRERLTAALRQELAPR